MKLSLNEVEIVDILIKNYIGNSVVDQHVLDQVHKLKYRVEIVKSMHEPCTTNVVKLSDWRKKPS